MDPPLLKAVRAALTTLERYAGNHPNVPDDVKLRAKICLTQISNSCPPQNNDSATPSAISTPSSTGDTSAASPPDSTQAEGPASDSHLATDFTKKRKRSVDGQNGEEIETDEEIENLFCACRDHVHEVENLVVSSLSDVRVLKFADRDPRAAHIRQLLRPQPADRFRALLAARSLRKDIDVRKGENGKLIYKELAGILNLKDAAVRHFQHFGKKSQEIADEYGSPGILWLLPLFTFEKWRFLRKDKISIFVGRVKRDEKLNRLADLYSNEWLWCEYLYEGAVRIQKSRLTEYQSQFSIQEVDDSEYTEHGCHNTPITAKRRWLELVTLPQANTETIGHDGDIGEDGEGSRETFQQSQESGAGSARAGGTQMETQTGRAAQGIPEDARFNHPYCDLTACYPPLATTQCELTQCDAIGNAGYWNPATCYPPLATIQIEPTQCDAIGNAGYWNPVLHAFPPLAMTQNGLTQCDTMGCGPRMDEGHTIL